MTSHGVVALACVRCASGCSVGSDGLGGAFQLGIATPVMPCSYGKPGLERGQCCRSSDGNAGGVQGFAGRGRP